MASHCHMLILDILSINSIPLTIISPSIAGVDLGTTNSVICVQEQATKEGGEWKFEDYIFSIEYIVDVLSLSGKPL